MITLAPFLLVINPRSGLAHRPDCHFVTDGRVRYGLDRHVVEDGEVAVFLVQSDLGPCNLCLRGPVLEEYLRLQRYLRGIR